MNFLRTMDFCCINKYHQASYSKFIIQKQSTQFKASLTMKGLLCAFSPSLKGDMKEPVLPEALSWLVCFSWMASYKLSIEPACNKEIYESRNNKTVIFLEKPSNLSIHLYIVPYLDYPGHKD